MLNNLENTAVLVCLCVSMCFWGLVFVCVLFFFSLTNSSVLLSPVERFLCGLHFVIQMKACTHTLPSSTDSSEIQAIKQPNTPTFGLCDWQGLHKDPARGRGNTRALFWGGVTIGRWDWYCSAINSSGLTLTLMTLMAVTQCVNHLDQWSVFLGKM